MRPSLAADGLELDCSDDQSYEVENFNLQVDIPLNTSIRSGDILTGACVFVSSERDHSTVFGLSSYE